MFDMSMFNLDAPHEVLTVLETPEGYGIVKQRGFVYPVFYEEGKARPIYRDFRVAKYRADEGGRARALAVCKEEAEEDTKRGAQSPLGHDPHYPW